MKNMLIHLIRTGILTLFIALTIFIGGVHGERADFQRKISRVFPVSSNALVILDNQFGSIVCQAWDKQEVAIEVVIVVEEFSQEKADKILNSIFVDIRQNQEQVYVKTQFPSGFKTRRSFQVNYLIRMPFSVNLQLSNAFGDVEIDERKGKTTMKLQYGNATIGKLLHADNALDVEFGSMKIDQMEGGVIQTGFSKIYLGSQRNLIMKSNYTEWSVEEVAALEGSMEGGKLHLTKAGVVNLKTQYADIHVGTLIHRLIVDGKFGNFEVQKVDVSCTSISITDEFGNYTIPLGPRSGFLIDVESKSGKIQLPEKETRFTEFHESGADQRYKGTVGNNATLQVKIISEFGNIKLK